MVYGVNIYMKKFLLSICLLLTLPIFSVIGAPAETITHWVDYRVMPTYFGIPLADTNASFYTLTNKIAVLDVRVTNLEAQTNSYASIYSLNQLSNRVVTLEGQTNSYALKTITNDLNNISSNLLVETSRATNAEYALNLKIGITSNYFYNYVTNLEGLININSNQTFLYYTNLSDQIIINSNQTFLYYTNVLQLLYDETNRANSVETNLQGQITSATNRISNLEGQTNSWATTNYVNTINTNLLQLIVNETNRAYGAETNLQGQVTSATNRISNLEGQTNTYTTTNNFINISNRVVTLEGQTNNWATTNYINNSIAWMPSYHAVSNFSAFLIGKTNQIPYGVEHGYLDLTTNTVIYMNTNNISTNTADTFAVDIYLNGFTLTCDNVTLTNTMSSMSGTMNTIIFRKGYRQSMYYGVGKVIQP